MRAITIIVWIWRSLAALYVAAVIFGYPLTGLGMKWLVDAEQWLTSNVPDPILFALAAGVVLSTLINPQLWAAAENKLFGKQRVHTDLAKLRTEGVELRNLGRIAAFTDDQWLDWEARLIGWRQNVRTTIERISSADAEMWYTLDTVPPPDLPMQSTFAGDHEKHAYAMHHLRIQKLAVLIDRYRAK